MFDPNGSSRSIASALSAPPEPVSLSFRANRSGYKRNTRGVSPANQERRTMTESTNDYARRAVAFRLLSALAHEMDQHRFQQTLDEVMADRDLRYVVAD